MAQSQTETNLVERVVRSPKGFIYRNPETGKRTVAENGAKIRVRVGTAKAHKDVLEDPAVLKAKMEALQVQEDAEKREAEANKASKTTPAQNSGQGQGQGEASGQPASK